MKILCTGDWHFGLKIGGYDFHDDIVRAVQVVIEAADKVDLLVHLGDVFHTSEPTPRDFTAVVSLLDQLNVPGVFLTGNHDVGKGTVIEWRGEYHADRTPTPDALEPLTKIRFRHPMQFVNLPTIAPVFDFDPLFLFAPYVTNLLARDQLEKSAQAAIDEVFEGLYSPGSPRMGVPVAAFCHLDLNGAKLGSEQAVLRGGVLNMPRLAHHAPFPVINGHIHKRQRVGDNIYLPGSIVPTDFSDVDGERGYLILEV